MNNKNNDIFLNKSILVTGGTGTIGRQIVIQLLKYHNPKIVKIFARNEYEHWKLQNYLELFFSNNKFLHIIGDIRDKEKLDEALFKTDIVFHCASLKHITYCEENPDEAIKTNVIGSLNLANLAIKNNVEKVIGISTDKAVEPTTLMGITKLLMERYLIKKKNSNTIFSIIRLGNVLNSRGSVIQKWQKQIENNKNITITDRRMKRFFLNIENVAKLIIKSVYMMKGEEIFVLKMPEISILDLAKETIKKYSFQKKIKIELIGLREREKIKEKLFTEEEKKLMYETNNFFIILPNKKIYEERKGFYL